MKSPSAGKNSKKSVMNANAKMLAVAQKDPNNN